MKRIIVLSIVVQGIAMGFHANAQVTETYSETRTRTEKDGKTISVQTETTTNTGGVYTHTNTNTGPVEVSFGIKANVNTSGFLLKNMPNNENSMNIGGSLGGFMKIEFQKGFAMQPELIIHYKTSSMKETLLDTKSDYEYWGIEIPIYYMGQLKMGKGKGFIGIGPYVSLGLDAKSKINGNKFDLYKKDEITDKSVMQRWDFGFGGMIGYEFKFGLQINAGYQIGLINALSSLANNAKMLNQSAYLGLAFKF